MSYLEKLKSNSKTNLNKLVNEAQKLTKKSNTEDERFWRVDRDKSGNAFAVIRFLPIPQQDAEDEKALQWVTKYTHGFKNDSTGLWYIEDSLNTIGQQDPVGEYNRTLWNKGDEASKQQARKQGRRTNYFSNIYVVKDPSDPSTEGKVYLFKYGKKIHDKIMNVINPDEAFGDDPRDPFDIVSGLDFKLKIRTVDGYPNYDLSEFDKESYISDSDGNELSDEELQKVIDGMHSLQELVSKDKFKTYEELKDRFETVMGISSTSNVSNETRKAEEEPKKETTTKPKDTKEDEDDDDLDFDSLLDELDD